MQSSSLSLLSHAYHTFTLEIFFSFPKSTIISQSDTFCQHRRLGGSTFNCPRTSHVKSKQHLPAARSATRSTTSDSAGWSSPESQDNPLLEDTRNVLAEDGIRAIEHQLQNLAEYAGVQYSLTLVNPEGDMSVISSTPGR